MRKLFLLFFILLNIKVFYSKYTPEQIAVEQEDIVPQSMQLKAFGEQAKGYFNKVLGVADKYLTNDPSTQKTTTGSFASALAQGLLRKATENTPLDVVVQNMSELKKFGPISEFLINLPFSLSETIKKADYNERFFSILHQDDKNLYEFSYDLQFRGSGNVNDPIGYILLKDGNKKTYYYNPSPAIFMVKSLLLNQQNSQNSVDNNFLANQSKSEVIDLKDKNFNLVLKRIISLLPKGDSIYQAITNNYTLTPEEIFFLKVLILISQAARNESNYPIYSHVPIELSLLLQRFDITPNLSMTNKNHTKKITGSYNWDSDKIIYHGDNFEDVDNIVPDFLKKFLENVKINESKQDVLEYESQNGLKFSQLDVLHSQMMLISGYKNRSSFFEEKILPINFMKLNDYDKKNYLKIFYFHYADRYSGFLDYLEKYQFSQIERSDKIEVDITLLAKAVDLRVGILKDLLANVKTSFSKNMDLLEHVEKIENLEISLDQEAEYIKNYVKSIAGNHLEVISAIQSNVNASFYVDKISIDTEEFKHYLLDLEDQNQDLILSLKEEGKEKVSLLDYLKIKHYFFKKTSSKKFRGDAQYIYQNYPLSLNEAINQGIAVILRANRDLEKAGDIFKDDSTIYEMLDPSGKKIKVSGKKVYQDTIKNSQSLKVKSEQDLFKIVSNTQVPEFEDKYKKAIEQTEKLNFYLNSLSKDFRHYAMQYNFDRRDLSELESGELEYLNQEKKDVSQMDANEAVKLILLENEIFGQNADVKFLAFKTKHKIEKLLEALDQNKKIEGQSRLKIQAQTRNLEEAIKTEKIFLDQIKKEQEYLDKLRMARIEKESDNESQEGLQVESEEEKKIFQMHQKSLNDFETVKKIKEEVEDNKAYLEQHLKSFAISRTYLEAIKSKIENTNFDQMNLSDEVKNKLKNFATQDSDNLSYFIFKVLNLEGESLQEVLNFVFELSLEKNDAKFLLDDSENQIVFLKLADSTLEDYDQKMNLLKKDLTNVLMLPEATNKISQILYYLKFFKDKKMLDEYLKKGLDASIKKFLEEKNIQVEIDSRKALENLKNLIQQDSLAPEELEEEQGSIASKSEMQKYDYARSVNQFLSEEFTNLMLRSDSFARNANFYFGYTMQNIFGITFEELINSNPHIETKNNTKLQELLELSSLYSGDQIIDEVSSSSQAIGVEIDDSPDRYVSIDEIPVDISDQQIQKLSEQISQDWNQAQVINKDDIPDIALAGGAFVQIENDDQDERIQIQNTSANQDTPTTSAQVENSPMPQSYVNENARRTSGYNSEYGMRR